MSNELDFAKGLIEFIYDSPTVFHAVDSTKEMLLKNGFEELKEEDRWKLQRVGSTI